MGKAWGKTTKEKKQKYASAFKKKKILFRNMQTKQKLFRDWDYFNRTWIHMKNAYVLNYASKNLPSMQWRGDGGKTAT